MPNTGDVIAAKYRIEQLIGLGGMGAVFSATHQYTGKRVALKWMLPELAQDGDAVHRFLREAQAAGRINHPNVVDVYDVGQHDSSYFLVMEYLQGEPLTSALARRDLSCSEVLILLLPAMRGVAAAHRQGVVHRDLKPDNIFLAYDCDTLRRNAKVLDFGISKLSSTEEQPNLHLTRTGAVVGTPYYMSPEQIRGSQQLDRRADIYAFGVILYEAFTGQVPFHAETYGALVLEIATGTPRALHEIVPALPAELSHIVLRAMARNAEDRYATMEDLVAALEPFARPSLSGAGSYASSSGRDAVGTMGALGSVGAVPGRPSGSTLVPPQGASEPASQRATPPELLHYAPPSAIVTKPHLASTPFASESSRTRSLGTTAVLGVAGLVAAVAVAAGGVWYFTREPARSTPSTPLTTSAPGSVPETPQRPSATETSRAAAIEQPAAEIPTGLSASAFEPVQPNGLDMKSLDIKSRARDVTSLQGLDVTLGDEANAPSETGGRDRLHGDSHEAAAASHPSGAHAPSAEHAPPETKLERRERRATAARRRTARSEPPEVAPRRKPHVEPAAVSSAPVAEPKALVAPASAARGDAPAAPVIHRARSGTLNVNEF